MTRNPFPTLSFEVNENERRHFINKTVPAATAWQQQWMFRWLTILFISHLETSLFPSEDLEEQRASFSFRSRRTSGSSWSRHCASSSRRSKRAATRSSPGRSRSTRSSPGWTIRCRSTSSLRTSSSNWSDLLPTVTTPRQTVTLRHYGDARYHLAITVSAPPS